MKKNKKLYFFDFEYFGWDDPVKLCADFVWHPSNKLNTNLAQFWIKSMIGIFSEDKDFQKRFDVSLPFYGMRWIMIILNEFFPEYIIRRRLAGNMKSSVNKSIQNIQLTKAIKYCKDIEKLIDFKLKKNFV